MAPCRLFLVLLLFLPIISCKKKSASRTSDVIEEVDRKKLEKLINEEQFLAVFFYTKSCKDCPSILQELERIDDDASNFGVAMVKNSEKSTAKKYNVTSFPALVYFRNQNPAIFEGDLKDEERVLAWLTDLDSMELPDKIEEVNAKILENLIEDTDFLAVLLYKEDDELSEKVLEKLENVDGLADAKNIGMVKIADESLAIEYGLEQLPSLIYYRKQIPLLYDGDLMNEEEVLNYLLEFQDLGEEEEAIEDVSASGLLTLIEDSPYLAVLFYDIENRRSQRILEELENIDDDCERHGIAFVKIDDDKVAAEFGIENLPALVYFENKMPNFYQGDLTKEDVVLDWLIKQTSSDEIEDVTDKVLNQMIKKTHELVVFFYDNDDQESLQIMEKLEGINDNEAELVVPFVKIDDKELAEAYGITDLPSLVFFENQVPNYFKGNLSNEEEVFQWLKDLQSSDEIEIVSDQVVELMIDKCEYLAVIFYDADDVSAKKALAELEHIDDETDKAGIPLIRSQSKQIPETYGIETPALVYFENGVPNIYPGELSNEDAVLKYLLEQQSTDEIEDVTPKVLEQMIAKNDHLAVLFYDKNDRKSKEVIRDLEGIEHEGGDEGDLPFVRIDNDQVAAEYGFEADLPVLVYFEKRIPSVYNGDLTNEQQVWKWLHLQLTTDGIEEVTEKILFNLITHNPFVAVLFYDHKSKKSAKVLKELESIDDDADQYNILVVKNDNLQAAQKYGIKKLPALLFFKEGSPIVYEGNLMKEEEVFQWMIDLLANDEIEDITENALDSLIDNNEFVVVFFYDKDSNSSAQILQELENIDDDTDRHGIPFVRIDDDTVAKEFGILDELPILVYFENKIPSVYEGDLMKEEEVLKWIIKQKEEDTIEEVTDEILEEMIKKYEYVLVFFAPNDCPKCKKILHELENIDDETDDNGILFVTTDDMKIAKKQAKLTEFPAVVLFRNGVPMVYKGDLLDEDALLKWVTSEEALDIPDKIDEVNLRMLDKLLDTSPYVAVLFYKENNPDCEKVLAELETIDNEVENLDIDIVKISDTEITEEYGIITFPTLVFFKKRFPQFYEGDLMDEHQVLKWLIENKEKKEDVIEFVDKKMLDVLLDDVDHICVYFYEKSCTECEKIINELENIDDDTDKHGIHFIKTDDVRLAEELGVIEFPSLVYFEHHIPSIYSGNLLNANKVLEWLLKEKNEDTIENINREMFLKLIEDREFLAVFFYGESDKESEDVTHHLEKIDHICTEYDVHLVKMSDKFMAKKYGVKNPPGLVLFRNGKPIKYPGKLKDEEEVLEFLTSPENMAVSDIIEKVNTRMFDRILNRFDYVAVFFFGSGCKMCPKVLDELEKIDDEAEAEGIHIVKNDDSNLAKRYGIFAFPALLFFHGPQSEPIIYAGDLKNGHRMLDWLLGQKDPSVDMIEEFEGEELRKLIQTSDHLAVFYYDKALCSNCESEKIDAMECEDCQIIMAELEDIHDDTKRNGIGFIKTTDLIVAKSYGIKITPALVYYENEIPSIYEGDLADENEVFEWLLHQKSEDTIETVNKAMLEKMIEESQYLAVFLYKPHCRACELALLELENIDDDTDLYGITVVRIFDMEVSKRYGIKTFPALIYFRNGNPLIFDGDLKNEEMVLEWLIDDDNRELADEIETINLRMLNKLVEESPFLAVYFYELNNHDCERVLMELEHIDERCDTFGIDLVKIFDPEAVKQYNVTSVPAIAFFRKQVAMFYEGDLYDEELLLKWLTSNEIFEIENEIEEVNRKMLEKLLEDNEFIAVFFYENNCEKCDAALRELEHVDDDADDLDIMFVKIKDPRYGKKFGITQYPALVYFRKKFPSIYRGNLLEEEEVLEWLRNNRYRHPEMNLFLYGLAAIFGSFILYTVFLIYCRHKNKEKKE